MLYDVRHRDEGERSDSPHLVKHDAPHTASSAEMAAAPGLDRHGASPPASMARRLQAGPDYWEDKERVTVVGCLLCRASPFVVVRSGFNAFCVERTLCIVECALVQ